jgi:energy-coupling factor transport system ATP-binding protein
VVIVEHRVEEALDLRPDRVLYLEGGSVAFLGPVEGFLKVADPDAVKLPFAVVLDRERSRPGAATPPPTRRSSDSAGPPRLAFDKVSIRLGDRDVLSGLTTSLGRREVVAVLGPNGAGKTTMFRAGMGLLRPSQGTISVDGHPSADRTVADLARIFGYVFQSPSQMLFSRTVRDELLFGPRNLGHEIGDPDAFSHSVLRRTSLDGLDGILDRPPMTLSFGQQKRLALAIALALEPGTLILDEPSAGQDHRTANQFLDEVLAMEGLESIFLITHDVDLALVRSDRILVIRDGTVVADGPPLAVIEDEDRWQACNLHRTTLMQANLALRPPPGRFLDGASLARRVVAAERGAGSAGGGPDDRPI